MNIIETIQHISSRRKYEHNHCYRIDSTSGAASDYLAGISGRNQTEPKRPRVSGQLSRWHANRCDIATDLEVHCCLSLGHPIGWRPAQKNLLLQICVSRVHKLLGVQALTKKARKILANRHANSHKKTDVFLTATRSEKTDLKGGNLSRIRRLLLVSGTRKHFHLRCKNRYLRTSCMFSLPYALGHVLGKAPKRLIKRGILDHVVELCPDFFYNKKGL